MELIDGLIIYLSRTESSETKYNLRRSMYNRPKRRYTCTSTWRRLHVASLILPFKLQTTQSRGRCDFQQSFEKKISITFSVFYYDFDNKIKFLLHVHECHFHVCFLACLDPISCAELSFVRSSHLSWMYETVEESGLDLAGLLSRAPPTTYCSDRRASHLSLVVGGWDCAILICEWP